MQELSKKSNKSISTLQRLFKEFLNYPPIPQIKTNNNCRLIVDATYFKDGLCLVNYLDQDLKYLQYYSIIKRENYDDIVADLRLIKRAGINVISITSDGHKSLIKAVKEVFPNIIHQRCVIHIQRMSLAYLTRFPKTSAGKTLRNLVLEIHKIETTKEKDVWISKFKTWCDVYHNFLQEKSESVSGKKWYTHKLLRRTRSLIQNALPDMFHYVDDPQIPKSTNGLESRFSYLKNNLKIHRGLTEEHRKNFILWYNYFGSYKPSQNMI